MTTASETPKADGDMKFEMSSSRFRHRSRQALYGGLGWRLDADFAAGTIFA